MRGTNAVKIETFVDITERMAILLLSAYFLLRIVPTLASHPSNIPLVVVEMATVILILVRKSGPATLDIWQIVIGFLGTGLPLMVSQYDRHIIPVGLGLAMMNVGLLLSFAAKLYLNRSFGIIAANRGVKRGGPYQLVRHPMYTGYMLTQIGFLALNFSAMNVAVYIAAWVAQVLRIREEEAFLLQDERYREFADAVRYRLVPGIY